MELPFKLTYNEIKLKFIRRLIANLLYSVPDENIIVRSLVFIIRDENTFLDLLKLRFRRNL
jgi:hypothetical protein